MVALRMHARVRARLDPSDVIQEAFVDVARRLTDGKRQTEIPFFLWVRMVTGDRLAQLHRKHLGATARNANCEVSLNQQQTPEASGAGELHELGILGAPNSINQLCEKVAKGRYRV